MDRTVPKTGSEEIELYMRTYYSLLRSSDNIKIETLVESHLAMRSSLHEHAAAVEPDTSALMYSALRLPACIIQTDEVLIGQMNRSFIAAGYRNIESWQRVYATGRRRRTHFDGDRIMAVYVVSRSDIDDLVPILTAFQIEWNKLHLFLQNPEVSGLLQAYADAGDLPDPDFAALAAGLRMRVADLKRLHLLWQEEFVSNLLYIRQHHKSMTLRLIAGSLSDYRRATASWWNELCEELAFADIDPGERPVYFVSSNTHSLINLLAGFARRFEESLIDYIEKFEEKSLLTEYEDIKESYHKSIDNFLYFVLRQYLSEKGSQARHVLAKEEARLGIHRIPSRHGFEMETQVIELGKLEPRWFDPRLGRTDDLEPLRHSNAIIINVDYPLGMASYELLSRISQGAGRLDGVYVMGKAATLNGRIGDMMIPNVIHDEHSQNTYLFRNCFTARHVRSYMEHGNVLDNQKAVTVLGTFLQNPNYMSVFYKEGYTDIEMEGGPYLSAVYEAFRPQRHPMNEIVNLHSVKFDIGFLHYASDKPMKTGQNLGAGSLSFGGVEPTYAAAIAILRRVFYNETEKLIETTFEALPAF
ncbi:MAG: hypothetical protein OXI77_05690 [Chloroflexota bacterium]|nr:hypothetical protein [Chloroflexota bacterium]MDE2908072.1 hypothetical protein [Chloroflexota bacterium]